VADKKISALGASTTPLAGTEVLPVVQSGSTVQVSVANLTAGRAVSMVSGTITDTIASPVPLNINNNSASTAAGTRVNFQFNGTIVGYVGNQFDGGDFNNLYNASKNHIFARGATQTMLIDNANDITVSAGNLKIGTAAKGIDFSANANAPGMTSELLNWYETGTFTPAWGGSITDPTNTYTSRTGRYTRIGDMVYCWVELVTLTSVGGSGNLQIKGLPFNARDAALSAGFASGFSSNFPSGCFANSTSTVTMTATVPGVQQQYLGIATLGATSYLACTIMYRIA